MASDEAKTEAILKAALRLFNARGFHGTPVPMIADEAGVGAGTIYRAFASKEALVNKLYQKWKLTIASRIIDDFPSDKPAREQFRTIWERMTDFALAHPDEISFLEFHAHGSYLDAVSQATEQGLVNFGVTVVERAQAAQALKPLPPRLLIELVDGAFLGVFRAAYGKRLPMTKEIFMQAEQCCWEAIRA